MTPIFTLAVLACSVVSGHFRDRNVGIHNRIEKYGSRTSKDPLKAIKPTYTQTDFDGFDYKGTAVILLPCRRWYKNRQFDFSFC